MDYEKLPSNSNKHRAEQQKDDREIRKVSSSVKIRKKSAFKRVADVFLEDDVRNVKSYILMDVLLPTIKDAIVDMVNGALEMMFYGTTRGRRSRKPSGNTDKASYTPYYASGKPTSPRRSSGTSEIYDYDDALFDTREEAEDFLLVLREYADKYDQVPVAKYYDALGRTGNFTDEKYGWSDLSGAKVKRVRDGWIVDLPRAEVLE